MPGPRDSAAGASLVSGPRPLPSDTWVSGPVPVHTVPWAPGRQAGQRQGDLAGGVWGPAQEINTGLKEMTKASPWVGPGQGLQWPFPSFYPHNNLGKGHTIPILRRGKLRPKDPTCRKKSWGGGPQLAEPQTQAVNTEDSGLLQRTPMHVPGTPQPASQPQYGCGRSSSIIMEKIPAFPLFVLTDPIDSLQCGQHPCD